MLPDLETVFETLGAQAAVITIPDGQSPPTTFDTTVVEVGAYNEPWPPEPGIHSLTKMRRRFGLRLSDIGSPDEILFGTAIAITGGDTFHVEATDLIDNERAIVLARKVP